MPKSLVRWVPAGAMLLGFAFAGCSSSGVIAPPAPGVTDTTCTQAAIGPEGGTLTHATGASLTVPAGALATSTALSLCGIAPASESTLGAPALAQGYRAGPSSVTLRRSVDLAVPFDASRLPAGADPGDAHVRMLRPDGSYVTLVTTVDLAAGILHTQTSALSDFMPADSPTALTIVTASLPHAVKTQPYSAGVDATGGGEPYTWYGGVLPEGLALDGNRIEGMPMYYAQTSYSFFMVVTDTAGTTVQKSFELDVDDVFPTLTSISPASAAEGDGDTVINLVGTGFEPTGHVNLTNIPLDATVVDSMHAYATISAQYLSSPGGYSIQFVNPLPSRYTTQSLAFNVSPSSDGGVDAGPADAGADATIDAGTDAAPDTGAPDATTDTGAPDATTDTGAPDATTDTGASDAASDAPNPVPTLTSVSPTTIGNDGTSTMTLTGTGFVPKSYAVMHGTPLVTQYVSPTVLTAIGDNTPGSFGDDYVQVTNPAPGGGTSALLLVHVVITNPLATLTSMTPATAPANSGPVTSILHGTGLSGGGADQGHVFFGSTELIAMPSSATTASVIIPPYLLAQPGTVPVTFKYLPPGGGTSNALPFTITASDAGAPDGGTDGTLYVHGSFKTAGTGKSIGDFFMIRVTDHTDTTCKAVMDSYLQKVQFVTDPQPYAVVVPPYSGPAVLCHRDITFVDPDNLATTYAQCAIINSPSTITDVVCF